MGEHTFPHLRDVLKAGALVADDKWTVEYLAEAACEIRLGSWDLEGFVRSRRVLADTTQRPDQGRAASYAADLVESPDLLEAVYEAVGPGTAGEIELLVDQTRRPYPIFVGPREEGPEAGSHWACCNCGALKNNDEMAVVLMGRDGFSDDLECPITYCATCISMASEVLRCEVDV